MTYQEIKTFINTYIVRNGVNAITGAQLNTILNGLADYKGFDSVVVTTLPAGSDATVTVQGMTLVLGIPKGADGRDGRDGIDGIDGQDAVNPFKGWFTTDNIPTTGQAGDYCNVSDTSVTPHTVTIYRWSTANNRFEDTGEVPDTATGETFASGETLQQVAIDDSHLVNPTNTADDTKPVLARAEDVMQLKAKLEGVTASEEKVQLVTSGEGQNVFAGKVVGATGIIDHSGNSDTNYRYVEFAIPSNVKSIRFMTPYGTGWTAGWAIGHYSEDDFVKDRSAVYASGREFTVKVEEGETHFRTNCYMMYGTTPTNRLLNFYCYLQSGSTVGEELSKIEEKFFNVVEDTPTPVEVVPNEYTTDSGFTSSNSFEVRKFDYNPLKKYLYSNYYPSSPTVSVYSIYFIGENDERLECTCQGPGSWNDYELNPPQGTLQIWVTIYKAQSSHFNLKSQEFIEVNLLALQAQSDKNKEDLSELSKKTDEVFQNMSIYHETPITDYELIDDVFLHASAGTTITQSSYKSNERCYVRKFTVNEGKIYKLLQKTSSSWTFYRVYFVNSNNVILSRQYSGSGNAYINTELTLPEGTAYIYVNGVSTSGYYTNMSEIGYETVNIPELKEQVDKNTSVLPISKLGKVVINHFGDGEGVPFYIRAKYNESKDVLITHRINDNGLVSFSYAYIGSNTLTDEQLMSSAYSVGSHTDSIAPLYMIPPFWHLFAQHGYPIPVISNTNNMTSDDVGTLWEDQKSRQYRIGKVTTSTIYLLPILTHVDNEYDSDYERDWPPHNKANDSDSIITSLTNVDGLAQASNIGTVNGYDYTQLRPVMTVSNRKFVVDGSVVEEPGVYNFDTFSVSESQVGYNPGSVQNWFGNDGKPVLEGADPTAKFTYSFNYCGAQCCVNTTIELLQQVKFQKYGALQQQYFVNNTSEGITAHFVIPKAKAKSGKIFNKPFTKNNSDNFYFYRRSVDLIDTDDLIDRCVGFLTKTVEGVETNVVGLASGLSLVSGDTVKQKRNQNIILTESTSDYCMLLSFSGSNNNKFYISAFNASPYASRDYHFPVPFFKEINYYVSYFDPDDNVGQVYWYKDGSRYVVYCHCQTIGSAVQVNVPSVMEGLKLSVVEKTDGATLLTDTVQNGKFFVSYENNSNPEIGTANHIVLIAE